MQRCLLVLESRSAAREAVRRVVDEALDELHIAHRHRRVVHGDRVATGNRDRNSPALAAAASVVSARVIGYPPTVCAT